MDGIVPSETKATTQKSALTCHAFISLVVTSSLCLTNVSTALTQLLERITLIGNALDLGREYISLMHIDSTVDENYHDLAKRK